MAERMIVTVCGRAGSKGFKNKNLKTFCAKPLVHYTLSAVELFVKQRPDLEVDLVLNTDSGLLRDLVCGVYPEATHLQRPAALGGDSVPKLAVFQHSLQVMEEKRGKPYDYLMDLDITSPLRTAADVYGCYDMLRERPELDLVMSAVKSRRNPYMNMAQREDGRARQVIKSTVVARQQAPQCYDLNASIYVFRRAFLAENSSGLIWDAACDLYEMLDTAVLDIDSEEDFQLMEIIARHLYAARPDFAEVRENIR
ncbi:acylneuraminate cytidylyltransferase family protein [Ruminococcaceae bacterium OttesenSCG-928-D13]|nr:acylneuraminate cytidylyltransferase family protein [Ruminococcaceae bacterium OttesenSCG-928-D13]